MAESVTAGKLTFQVAAGIQQWHSHLEPQQVTVTFNTPICTTPIWSPTQSDSVTQLRGHRTFLVRIPACGSDRRGARVGSRMVTSRGRWPDSTEASTLTLILLHQPETTATFLKFLWQVESLGLKNKVSVSVSVSGRTRIIKCRQSTARWFSDGPL